MKHWLKILPLLAVLMALTACRNPSAVPTAADASSLETRTPFQPDRSTATPTLHPTVTAQPTHTPTPTEEPSCQETHGQVIVAEMQPAGYEGALTFNLYLPACYAEEAPVGGYPLLILIHGQTYTEQQWIDIGLVDRMDSMVASGEIQPYVIAMPFESTGYSSGLHNAITDDLIPYLQGAYNLCTGRDCLAIGGISRGGGWALTAVAKHPEMFVSLGLHSTPVSDAHIELVRYQVAIVGAKNFPRIALDFGDADYWYSAEMDMVNAFTNLGVPHELYLNTGQHNNDYWSAHIAEYLRWYAAGWE